MTAPFELPLRAEGLAEAEAPKDLTNPTNLTILRREPLAPGEWSSPDPGGCVMKLTNHLTNHPTNHPTKLLAALVGPCWPGLQR